jgi:transposase
MSKSSKKREKYSEEFKRDSVVLHLKSGRTMEESSKNLGIAISSLSRWVKEYSKELSVATGTDNIQEELRKLRKENSTLRQERDILKKAARFFANEGA